MVVKSTIKIRTDELSKREWRKLLTKLTFFDAKGREARAYRLTNSGVEIPRGAWNLLPDHIEYTDERVCPSAAPLTFRGTLDLSDDDKSFSGQQEALEACLENEQGIIVRPPGTGKSIIAFALIAKLETNCIVFVHTEDIFNQWIEYAQKSLGYIPGTIRGELWENQRVTIAMVQTVARDLDRWEQYAKFFGCLIGDEVHHVAAPTWEMIVNLSPSKYRFGFTATKTRADGMHPLMPLLMGPVLQDKKIELKMPTKVVPVKSGFYFPYRGSFDWGRLQEAIVKNDDRNVKIADTAARQMQKGHSVLILSRRIEHLEQIQDCMWLSFDGDEGWLQQIQILTGKTPGRKKILNDFRAGKIKCLLSTQLADEALDVPILSRVILSYPGKHDGRIIQQVGRALREHPTKDDAIIFDIVDDRIGVLRRQWMERKQAYKKMKIPVQKKKQDDETTPVNKAQARRISNSRIRARVKRS